MAQYVGQKQMGILVKTYQKEGIIWWLIGEHRWWIIDWREGSMKDKILSKQIETWERMTYIDCSLDSLCILISALILLTIGLGDKLSRIEEKNRIWENSLGV
jgi:hypothetical protein